MTQWSQFDQVPVSSVSNTGSTLLSGLAFEIPGTIIRTRGMITIFPTSFGADLNVVGAFGIGLVSAEAFAAGIASVPEPYADSDWGGWMVLQPFAFHLEFTGA